MKATLLVPCRNEASTVGRIVKDARGSGLAVVVVDNGSTDGTAEAAAKAGATVVREPLLPGKGNAVRAGLEAVSTPRVVLADGDLTAYNPVTSWRLADAQGLSKGFYSERGRVGTVAAPTLATLHPALAGIRDPLCGEWAAPTEWLRDAMRYPPGAALGYGLEVHALLTAARDHLPLWQIDAGPRAHSPHADVRGTLVDVLEVALMTPKVTTW